MTAAPSSKAPEASASAASSALPAATTNVNGTAAAGSGTTNGTAAATSSSSAAATSSAYLAETPESLRCHVDPKGKPDKDASPFCEPKDGQHVLVGTAYNGTSFAIPNPTRILLTTLPVTWDPTLFAYNSTNKVELHRINGTNTSEIWSHSALVNEQGYVEMPIHDDYGANGTNLTLYIHSIDEQNGDPTTKSGPMLTLVSNSTTSNHTSSNDSSSSKQLGEKAGIPVGLGIVLIAAAGLIFWFLRRRRNKSAGYLANRPRGTTRMTGDGSGGFRDEPTRGLELQDRAGHGRQDSWEAGWDTASSQGGGRGGGNTFRDEIDRQRRR